jgi:hypothetical protein
MIVTERGRLRAFKALSPSLPVARALPAQVRSEGHSSNCTATCSSHVPDMLDAFARFALHWRTPAPGVAASAWTFRLHAHCRLGRAFLGAKAFAGFGAVCHLRSSILRRFAARTAFRQLSLERASSGNIYSMGHAAQDCNFAAGCLLPRYNANGSVPTESSSSVTASMRSSSTEATIESREEDRDAAFKAMSRAILLPCRLARTGAGACTP